jgi:hypothetical protein
MSNQETRSTGESMDSASSSASASAITPPPEPPTSEQMQQKAKATPKVKLLPDKTKTEKRKSAEKERKARQRERKRAQVLHREVEQGLREENDTETPLLLGTQSTSSEQSTSEQESTSTDQSSTAVTSITTSTSTMDTSEISVTATQSGSQDITGMLVKHEVNDEDEDLNTTLELIESDEILFMEEVEGHVNTEHTMEDASIAVAVSAVATSASLSTHDEPNMNDMELVHPDTLLMPPPPAKPAKRRSRQERRIRRKIMNVNKPITTRLAINANERTTNVDPVAYCNKNTFESPIDYIRPPPINAVQHGTNF